MTNLVLMTGLPAVGKSTVAQRLVSQYGFAILSTDDLRQSLFRQDYATLRNGCKGKENVMRDILDFSKLHILKAGYDLVIDSTSPTEKFRRRMLILPENLEQTVKKSMLYVSTDEQTNALRNRNRGGEDELIRNIQILWIPPQEGFCGADLYNIGNNGNLDQLYEEIDKFYQWLKKG